MTPNEMLSMIAQLRRERDEARAGRQAYKQLAVKHAQERDEAREAFVIATDQMVIAQGKVREANKERDEAREQIKELIYIAERAIALAEIDFENDKFGVVSELRDGLERIKEAAK
jgi:predicted house-cleaning NTP pyrophosphatase (Maf/HAM1 superfamily)